MCSQGCASSVPKAYPNQATSGDPLAGASNLPKLIRDLEGMGFLRRDIDEGIDKVGGVQRINMQPAAEATQAVLDAILSKQQQQGAEVLQVREVRVTSINIHGLSLALYGVSKKDDQSVHIESMQRVRCVWCQCRAARLHRHMRGFLVSCRPG